jgi:hypothetical protein
MDEATLRNRVNKYKFTDKFMRQLRKDIRGNKQTAFITKFQPTVKKNGTVKIGDNSIVPRSQVKGVIKTVVEQYDVPLGIRSMQAQLLPKWFGITRSMIRDYLQADGILQEIRRRPNTRTVDRSQLKGEGSTDFILKKYPNTTGIDLIELTTDSLPPNYVPAKFRSRQTTKNYIAVVVHKRTGYLFAVPIVDKEAGTVKKAFIPIKRRITKLFGGLDHLESDAGLEFAGDFSDYLRQQGIHKKVLRLVSYVERANSTLQRYLIFVAALKKGGKPMYTYEQALKKAVAKYRNIKSRVTGKTGMQIVKSQEAKDVNRLRPGIQPGERKHRKWQGGRHKKTQFKVGQTVRYLRKMADRDKSGFYRSYVGAHKKKKWSANMTITKKHGNRYKLSNGDWREYTDLISVKAKKVPVKPVKKRRGAPAPRYRAPPKPKPAVRKHVRKGRAADKALRRKNKRKNPGVRVKS